MFGEYVLCCFVQLESFKMSLGIERVRVIVEQKVWIVHQKVTICSG